MEGQSSTQRKATTDAVKADPKHYKVEFENEKVRVLRITYGPNQVRNAHPSAKSSNFLDRSAQPTHLSRREERGSQSESGSSAVYRGVGT
jgi:hypothetical protein